MAVNGNGSGVHRPIGDLLKDLASGTQTLASQELTLAKLELKESMARARSGIILFAGAAVLALVGLILISATLAVALVQLGLTPWLAGLIVSVGLFIVAGILALAGKGALARANPKPTQTLESLKEDREWLRQQMR